MANKKIKKTSKKRTNILAIDILIVLVMIFSIGSLGAYKLYQKYYFKDCKEFDFDNGNYVEHRISGMEESDKTFFNIPISSCRESTKDDYFSFKEKGLYSEKKSCGEGKDGKNYIQTSYERCLFGCFAGKCMDKCESPDKDNIFKKGISFGIEDTLTGLSELDSISNYYTDYCTDENGNQSKMSKNLVKRSCNEDNFLTKESIECENICFDGACQKENFKYCEDTDSNDQGKLVGLVSYYDPLSKTGKTKIDSCDKNGKMVTEYFCGKDKLPHKLILTCRYSCVDGQCLQK